MEIRICKIIIALTISLFLCTFISPAQAQSGRQHKSHGKTNGYHSDQDRYGHHPGWQREKPRSYRNKHRRQNYYHRYYYHKYWGGHYPGWKKWNYKSLHRKHEHKRRLHKRLDGWKLHDRDRHGRHQGGNEFILGMAFYDPYMAVVIGAMDN